MNKLFSVLATLLLSSCALFHHGSEGIDLGRLADEIAEVRADVADLVPLASPETQAQLAKLDAEVYKVEAALRAAATGGPVKDVTSAATVALALADSLLATMPDAGDMRLYVGLARIVLRHIAASEFDKASEDIETTPAGMRAARRHR